MIFYGKEYNFLYTVRASIEIAQNLDGHSISAIGKVFQTGDQIKSMELIIRMAIAMNRAYLKAKAFEDGTKFDESDVITKEIIENMPFDVEQQLENELMMAMSSGNKTEIETAPEKAVKGSKKNLPKSN